VKPPIPIKPPLEIGGSNKGIGPLSPIFKPPIMEFPPAVLALKHKRSIFAYLLESSIYDRPNSAFILL